MVDLTKYLVYKATGMDDGVISFNFNEYEPKSFNSSGEIYGNSVQEKVWFALRDAGYSEEATAGAMGNIYGESGFDPTLIEYGQTEERGGIGLCQWTFSRCQALRDYANEQGKEWQDVQVQIEYLLMELEDNGYFRDPGIYSEKFPNGKSSWTEADSVETATKAFCATFEKPSASAFESSKQKRINAAQEYYEEFKGKTKPSGSSNSADGDGYTSIYTASSGKQYKEYKQYEGSYSSMDYAGYGPISSVGCSITAIAITLTGYGVDVNPGDLAGSNYLNKHYSDYGITSSRDRSVPASADRIRDSLQAGKPVVVEIGNGTGELKAGGAVKKYTQHFIAVLDINSEGEVYISDPGSTTTNGWENLDDLVAISKSALYVDV